MHSRIAMSPEQPRVDDLTQLASLAEREHEPDTAAVIGDVIQHGRELVHAEFALAKAELKAELGRIQTGAIALALGGSIGLASLFIALVALAIQLELDAGMVALASACAAILGAGAAWWGQRRIVAPRLAITRGSLARGRTKLKQVTDDEHDAR
ncbi:MAG TPA: phage holin family protein [Polyangiaceae bacterium]